MTINQNNIDILRHEYHVHYIETRMARDEENEIEMRISATGFYKLLEDLMSSKHSSNVEDVFSITTIENKTDGIYVVKYPINEHPLDLIKTYGEQLRERFDAEGRTLILMPKEIDVSVLNIAQLKQLRDDLSELINNLNYDNIIGF